MTETAAFPYRFHTPHQLDAAAWPDCMCGHPARLHGLLRQHVGGSGCFRTWQKDNAWGNRVYAGGCDCATYRPDEALTAEQIALAPLTIGRAL